MICRELFIASFSTLGMMLFNIFSKEKISTFRIVVYFFVLWSLLFGFGKCFAGKVDSETFNSFDTFDIYCEDGVCRTYENGKRVYTKQERSIFLDMSKHCQCRSTEYICNAKEMSLLIPDDNLRELTSAAFGAATASLMSGGDRKVVIGALFTLLGSYFVGVYENFKSIEIELIKAEIMLDQKNFYLDVYHGLETIE